MTLRTVVAYKTADSTLRAAQRKVASGVQEKDEGPRKVVRHRESSATELQEDSASGGASGSRMGGGPSSVVPDDSAGLDEGYGKDV